MSSWGGCGDNIRIGDTAQLTRAFEGVLDEFRFYTGVLSGSEVLALYNNDA